MLKKISRLSFFISASLILATPAFAEFEPVKTSALFHTAYIPQGFDSNDQVQIVGEGVFPSSCYRPAEARLKVDHLLKKIIVDQRAYKYSGPCALMKMVLPFDRVLEVGLLQPGRYEIIQAEDQLALGSIPVARTTSLNPDDYMYAPISQAFYRESGNQREILLSGEFPNSCMAMKEVRIHFDPNVIVVQPIAEMTEAANCVDGKFPFTKRVAVNGVKSGRHLLHVRSMNAKAINTLVFVQ